jgi:hypothetical protein
MSLLDQIKDLEKQRQKLVSAAKAEALKQAEEAIERLNALGFTYSLSEGKTTVPPSPRRKGVRQEVLDLIKPRSDSRGFFFTHTNRLHTRLNGKNPCLLYNGDTI